MSYEYLILDDEVHKADVMKKFYFLRWDWLDEVEETDKSPFTLFFKEGNTNTLIYYRQEDKPDRKSKYFYIQGEDIEGVVNELKSSFPMISIADLIKGLDSYEPMKRISSIYQLGIVNTGKPFDLSIYDAFEKALNDTDKGVKLAALNGIAWPHWDELLILGDRALEDSDEEVSKKARLLLEAFTFQKTLDLFLEVMQMGESEEKTVKLIQFNKLYDEFTTKFPYANTQAIAREASTAFGISIEEAMDDLAWVRNFKA